MQARLRDLILGLSDEASLGALFAFLGYDQGPDEPDDRSGLRKEENDGAKTLRIIARTGDYRIYHIGTAPGTTPRVMRAIAKKIILYHRHSLVCSQNHDDKTWIFSGPTETAGHQVCHIPVSVKNADINPPDFARVAQRMAVKDGESYRSVFERVAGAFDAFGIPGRRI